MKPFVAGLMLWALSFSGTCDHTARVQGPETPDKDTAVSPLTLTNEHTVGSFPMEPDTIANPPQILEVSVSKVTNPDGTPFGIFVYLAPVGRKGEPEPERILVGNFSLYPPDRPGKFSLGASHAFQQLRAKALSTISKEVRLMFEIKRVRETQPWTPLEIIIAPSAWRRDHE